MATHNGAGTLPRVLDAYTQLRYPAVPWKIVVVDNASTDGTSAILAAYAGRLPIESIYTPRRGKNIALNLGVAHCQGDLVVFTDDDAVPQADWLSKLFEVVISRPEFDIFGGGIDPLWPDGQCPPWISRLVNLGATFAVTPVDLGEGPVPAAQVWGPNMAVRRRVFDEGHRFDESVGPSSGQYVMGSEVEFTTRLERAGYRAWFAAAARVGHIIRSHQLQPAWIIQRGYRLGRHMFHQESSQAMGNGVPRLRGAPRWMYGKLVKQAAQAFIGRVKGDFDQRFLADWEISFLRGYLYEAARHAKSAH
ncbi:glycosyltransferase [Aquincola sp. MAHUQ-54]|uniref:Glycosyltransferase n=1 Tax=Aquincola agrisoli TaxID=3119538 RepID=A0AAW9QA51_9BURK